MNSIRAGDLDRRIDLLKPQSTRSPSGAVVTTYVEAATRVYAGRWQLSAKEVQGGAAVRSSAQFKFVIRHRRDVGTTWRVRFEGKLYDIVGTEEIGRRAGLFLFASQETN